MKTTVIAICCSLFLGALTCLCHAEDFGITEKTFDVENIHTVFTFRNGILLHEVTVFSNLTSDKRKPWVERFYADNQPVFSRAGGAGLISERYTGLSRVGVTQGTGSNKPYPQRLSVGSESFNLGEDGFYHLIADPQSVLRESIIYDGEYSARVLDEERAKYLNQSKSHE